MDSHTLPSLKLNSRHCVRWTGSELWLKSRGGWHSRIEAGMYEGKDASLPKPAHISLSFGINEVQINEV
jgi:hypothetical protein